MLNKKNVTNFTDCYGCGVCAIACPHNIISIRHNDDGFYAPFIDNEEACTNCALCISSCSYADNKVITSIQALPKIESYAAWSNSQEIRYMCSSGGVGLEIAKFLLRDGYKICAVKYNTNNNLAEHYMACNEEDLLASAGSKYIQSYTLNAFKKFKRNQKYLVFGTPCQIDSLRRFIIKRKQEHNYILVDFFCHGVPSYNMWKKYLQELNEIIDKVTNVVWRDKTTGWHDSWAIAINRKDSSMSSKYEYFSLKSQGDTFYKLFLSDSCLGKACYNRCKYKMESSAADIRLGDLWGTAYQDNEEGVSGVLVLTSNGKDLLNKLSTITKEAVTSSTVMEVQMKKNPKMKWYVKYIMNDLKRPISLSKIYTKYVITDKIINYPYNFFKRAVNRIKRTFKVFS